MILNYSCDLLDFWSYTMGLKVPITIISEMTPCMNISISETFNYSWGFFYYFNQQKKKLEIL